MHTVPTILFRNRHPLFSDVDTVLSKFFQDAPTENGSVSKGFPLDLRETEDSYIVSSELPGVKKEEVDVSLEKNILTILANRAENKEAEEGKFLVRERRSSQLARRLSLPLATNESEVEAKLEEGILTVTVKKAPEKKPKRIEIR